MKTSDNTKLNEARLSDRIIFAMDLALDQKDAVIADMLSNVLELAMTRNAGGQKFVERRSYPEEAEKALQRLIDLKHAGS